MKTEKGRREGGKSAGGTHRLRNPAEDASDSQGDEEPLAAGGEGRPDCYFGSHSLLWEEWLEVMRLVKRLV